MGIKFIVETVWHGKNKRSVNYDRHSTGQLKLYTQFEADARFDSMKTSAAVSIIAVEEDEIAWNNELYQDS